MKLSILLTFLLAFSSLLQGWLYPSITDSSSILLTKKTEKPPDFSGQGRSGRQTSLDSRGICPPGVLTGIMPTSNQGKTIHKHPVLWFYVSYPSQQISQGEFILQDDERNDIQRLSFKLPNTPGLVNVKIPISLKVNQWYRWYFQLSCQSEKSQTSVFVQGWIQRIPLNSELQNDLKQAQSREYTVYTTYQIWYDAVASLAEQIINDSSDTLLRQRWLNLLSANGVNLEQLSQQPLIGSVILETQELPQNHN